jgi:hypothetical protein
MAIWTTGRGFGEGSEADRAPPGFVASFTGAGQEAFVESVLIALMRAPFGSGLVKV